VFVARLAYRVCMLFEHLSASILSECLGRSLIGIALCASGLSEHWVRVC
jgi:hypothetical protein